MGDTEICEASRKRAPSGVQRLSPVAHEEQAIPPTASLTTSVLAASHGARGQRNSGIKPGGGATSAGPVAPKGGWRHSDGMGALVRRTHSSIGTCMRGSGGLQPAAHKPSSPYAGRAHVAVATCTDHMVLSNTPAVSNRSAVKPTDSTAASTRRMSAAAAGSSSTCAVSASRNTPALRTPGSELQGRRAGGCRPRRRHAGTMHAWQQWQRRAQTAGPVLT